MNRRTILHEIIVERERQYQKWGRSSHSFGAWLAILMEEVGEAAKAGLEDRYDELHKELIQCAAVLVAWLEEGFA